MHQNRRLVRREPPCSIVTAAFSSVTVDLLAWPGHHQNYWVSEACICPFLFPLSSPLQKSSAHLHPLHIQNLSGDTITPPCLDSVLQFSPVPEPTLSRTKKKTKGKLIDFPQHKLSITRRERLILLASCLPYCSSLNLTIVL